MFQWQEHVKQFVSRLRGNSCVLLSHANPFLHTGTPHSVPKFRRTCSVSATTMLTKFCRIIWKLVFLLRLLKPVGVEICHVHMLLSRATLEDLAGMQGFRTVPVPPKYFEQKEEIKRPLFKEQLRFVRSAPRYPALAAVKTTANACCGT